MQYSKFRANASGNNTLVAGQANKRIDVYAIFFQANATAQVTLRSGTTSGGDITGPMTFSTGGGVNLPYAGFSLFSTAAGEALTMHLSGILPDCAGAIMYDIVEA